MLVFDMPDKYTKLALLMAVRAIDEDKFTPEAGEKCRATVEQFVFPTSAEENKAVAEYNGITLVDLISSPNMEALRKNYANHLAATVVKSFRTELDVTEEQAWGLLYMAVQANE